MIVWVLLLIGGIAILLPLYSLLLRDFQKYNETEYREAGSPTLFMISPGRGIRLQKFIYIDSRKPGIHPAVAAKSMALAILMPLYVVSVFALYFWGMWKELSTVF